MSTTPDRTTNPPEADWLSVTCPACNAPAGKPCTAPTDTGRRPVGWAHNVRTDLARGWT